METEKISATGFDSTENISCKLTTPELQQRKITVLASLQKQIAGTKELDNGYAYKFADSNSTLDELISFIKSERACCNFFTFDISVNKEKGFLWLILTGPGGTKDFIKTEMGL